MKPIYKNILAVICGWLVGSVINFGIVQLGNVLLPIEGVEANNMKALAEVLPTLNAEYFIFPFLAHALGTFVAAIVTGIIAANRKMLMAIIVGILFLIGGIMVNYMLPGPLWFTVVDIVLAYIPMAWLGGTIAIKISKSK